MVVGGWVDLNEINAILNSVEVKVEVGVELGNYVSFIKQLMQCLRSCNDEVLFGVSYIIRPEYVFKIRESY